MFLNFMNTIANNSNYYISIPTWIAYLIGVYLQGAQSGHSPPQVPKCIVIHDSSIYMEYAS